MKGIFESCFNDYETTSFMPSSASVSYGSMKCEKLSGQFLGLIVMSH
jgi:hypothetical protein